MTVYHSGLQKGGVHRKKGKKKVTSYQSFIAASITHATGTVTTFGEMLSPKHPSVSGQVQRGLTADCCQQARYQHAQSEGLTSRTKGGPTCSWQGRTWTQTPGALPSCPLSFPSPNPLNSFRHIYSPPPIHFIFFFSVLMWKQVSKPQESLVVL